jgi:hypothetical protein
VCPNSADERNRSSKKRARRRGSVREGRPLPVKSELDSLEEAEGGSCRRATAAALSRTASPAGTSPHKKGATGLSKRRGETKASEVLVLASSLKQETTSGDRRGFQAKFCPSDVV